VGIGSQRQLKEIELQASTNVKRQLTR